MAALFTRLNTLVCKYRMLLLAKIRNNLLKRLARMLETIVLVVRTLYMSTAVTAVAMHSLRDIAFLFPFSSRFLFLFISFSFGLFPYPGLG